MPLPALTLWADSNRGELVTGWQVNSNLGPLNLRQGDTVGIELHWVEQGAGTLMREVVWPPAANITLAIGRIDSAPSSGVYRLAYAGAQTTDLAYNATAVQIQAALNALAGITADGGVTVIKATTTIRVTWNSVGVPSGTLTLYENDLTPTSSIGIGTARAGSLTAAQITQLHIKQAPVAVCTVWEDQTTPTITVTETHAPAYSGDFRIWRVVISPSPKAGTFRLSKTLNGQVYWTAPINISGLSASTISVATGMNVTAVDDYEFEISQSQIEFQPNVNVSAMGADDAGLIPYSSKYGQLSMNALDVELLLAGAPSGSATLEIEVEMDGKRQTLVQNAVTIYNDLIDTDSYTLQEWGDVIPADSVVRFDTVQTLTTGQKLQVRTNIGAVGADSLAPYTTKDNELEVRISALEGVAVIGDIADAVNGAATPSATNVFATMDDLADKADTVHTHAITDVTGLAAALADKAALTHGHVITDITNLQDTLDDLDLKADAVHTHVVGDVTGLQTLLDGKSDVGHTHTGLPTPDQADAMLYASSPTGANPFATQDWVAANTMTNNPVVNTTTITGTHNGTNYPYEIQLVVNGTTYYVPARI